MGQMTVKDEPVTQPRGSPRLCLALVLCLLGASPLARAATPIIGTSTAGDPMNTGHKYFTHYANGHYWVAFDNGGIGSSFFSSPDGVTWTSLGTIVGANNPKSFTNEWAVRSGQHVIAAAFIARPGTTEAGR